MIANVVVIVVVVVVVSSGVCLLCLYFLRNSLNLTGAGNTARSNSLHRNIHHRAGGSCGWTLRCSSHRGRDSFLTACGWTIVVVVAIDVGILLTRVFGAGALNGPKRLAREVVTNWICRRHVVAAIVVVVIAALVVVVVVVIVIVLVVGVGVGVRQMSRTEDFRIFGLAHEDVLDRCK
jgi:hypothetical protein